MLDTADIPYALSGAMALNHHGYRRVTVNVDLLLTRDGLDRLKHEALDRGYVEKFPGSKGLRDTEHNVVIDVLLAGDYPGDGKPKPVRRLFLLLVCSGASRWWMRFPAAPVTTPVTARGTGAAKSGLLVHLSR